MQLGEDEQLPFNKKTALFAIGCGALSSILAISLITGSGLAIILAYLAPFPLFMAGLGHGGKPAAIAAFSGIVFTTFIGGPLTGCIYAIMNAFPSWLAIRLVLTSRTRDGHEEWFPLGYLLSTFSVYGSALFILGVVFLPPSEGSLLQMVEGFLSSTVKTVGPMLNSAQIAEIVGSLTQLFPAMVLVSWMIMTIINATLAQGVLAKSGKALRPSPNYGAMTLPDFASWAFVACAAVTVIADGDMEYIARNLTVVMALPFFALGLTVVHKAVRATPIPGVLLGAFYLLLLLSIWVALPVIGLGLIEQWIGIRSKLSERSDIQEND